MDDEPMWAADRVVTPTSGFAIIIPETANEFAIKGNIIKIFYHGLSEITQEVLNAIVVDIFLYKTPNQAYQLLEDKVLLNLDWAKNQKTKSSLKKTVAFADEGSSNSNTDKIIARMDAMTIKIDAQYKELQSRTKQSTPDLDDDDMPMSREEEAKFMQTFHKNHFYNDYHNRDSNRDNWRSSGQNNYNRDNYRSNTDDKPYDLQKQFNDFMKLADKQSGRPSGSLPSNTQLNPRGGKAYQPPQAHNEHVNSVFTISEEAFDVLLDEGSKILYSIKGTLLEEEIFAKFDEFMAMIADGNSDFESDTEEPPFDKITINTDY
nr:hypothetical protein [Tanacetum cinerariifolium]